MAPRPSKKFNVNQFEGVEVPDELKPLSLLQEAEMLINGQRQQDYGDKLQNFAHSAMILTGILAHKLQQGESITPEDVAAIMIGMKLARASKTPSHRDSWLDIAGYAGCVDKLQMERRAGYQLPGAVEDSNG